MARNNTPHDLDILPSKELFAIARDRSAADRLQALGLIQRCSSYIRRPEISAEVEALLATPARTE